MEMLNAALSYAAKGYRVFPTHSVQNGKCTCGQPSCSSPGKHPIFTGWQEKATTDREQIEIFWRQWPWANVAIATGRISDVIVLDVDMSATKNGIQSLAALEGRFHTFPKTYTVRTGSGGLHYYFSTHGDVFKNSAGRLGDGLDIRGDGGYVIAPPSLHISGNRYTVEHDYV